MTSRSRTLLGWTLALLLGLGCGTGSDEVRDLAAAGLEKATSLAAEAVTPTEAEPAAEEKAPYYKFTDDSGSVRFVTSLDQVPAHLRSQAQPAGRGKLSRAPSTAPRRPTTSSRPIHPAPRRAEVVVYTAPWCGWCRKTLAWLDARSIPYENKDIEQDDRYRVELKRKTGRTSIPFVEIGDQTIAGFSPGRMERLLERQRL